MTMTSATTVATAAIARRTLLACLFAGASAAMAAVGRPWVRPEPSATDLETSLPPAGPVAAAGTPERTWQDATARHVAQTLRPLERVADPALADGLDAVLRRVAGDRAATLHLVVVRQPGAILRRWPDGTLLVTSGLLLRLDSDAQFAALLAHELGHPTSQRPDQPQAVTDVAPQAEHEADRAAMATLHRVGYDLREAVAAWTLLADEEDVDSGTIAHIALHQDALHPSVRPRIAWMAQLASLVPAGGDTGRDEYRARLSPHLATWIDDEIGRGVSDRTFWLWDRLIGVRPGSSALQYARGESLRRRGKRGDDVTALQALQRATSLGAEPPATWRSIGRLHLNAGRAADARAAFERYLAIAPDAPDAPMIRHLLQRQENS